MVFRGRRRLARKPKGRKPARRGRGRKAVSKQFAHCIETVDYRDVSGNVGYSATFTLNDFTRAPIIASQYRWYRAKKVEWIYQPFYNTFQEGSGDTAAVIPNLLWIMNRNQAAVDNNGIISRGLLEQMGAKPIKFTKNYSVSYKPNWCMPGLQAATSVQGANVSSPAIQVATGGVSLGMTTSTNWLSTSGLGFATLGAGAAIVNKDNQGVPIAPDNSSGLDFVPELTSDVYPQAAINPNLPGSVVYNGHVFYLEQSDTLTQYTHPIGRLTARVHWEFKDPSVAYSKQPVSAHNPGQTGLTKISFA